jgi:hypothetical protein
MSAVIDTSSPVYFSVQPWGFAPIVTHAQPVQFLAMPCIDKQFQEFLACAVAPSVPVVSSETLPVCSLAEVHSTVWQMEHQWSNQNLHVSEPLPAKAGTVPLGWTRQTSHGISVAMDAQPISKPESEHDQSDGCELDLEAYSTFEMHEAEGIADELLCRMHEGPEGQWSAVTSFLSLAHASESSSRAAQAALQRAHVNDAVLLASSLRGHVRPAIKSSFANYVVQKIIVLMPAAGSRFIIEEVIGHAYTVACHRFGCRVLCRILEHASFPDDLTEMLLEELLMKIDKLCSHNFGNYVARHILEFGLPEHRHRVANAILSRAPWLAKHRVFSRLVEVALRLASPEDQFAIAAALTADEDVLASLATSQCGRYVIEAMLEMPATRAQAVGALSQVECRLGDSKFGREVLSLLHNV